MEKSENGLGERQKKRREKTGLIQYVVVRCVCYTQYVVLYLFHYVIAHWIMSHADGTKGF